MISFGVRLCCFLSVLSACQPLVAQTSEKLLTQLQQTGEVPFATYVLDEPLVIDESLEGRHLNFNGSTLSGFPIVFKTKFLTVTSVTVTKSKHGFVYLRGQGAAFINLRALECEVGHYFGAAGYFRNSQVAWSSFTNLTALECGVGIMFDGTATANRNWCNNVTFVSTAIRHCKLGYQTINSAIVSYTNFVGGHAEFNERMFDCPEFANVSMLGCHMVPGKDDHEPMIFGRNCFALGGRFMADYIAPGGEFTVGGTGKSLPAPAKDPPLVDADPIDPC